jgi:hypothetical protein
MYRSLFILIFVLGLQGCTGERLPSLTGKVEIKAHPDLKFRSDSLEFQSIEDPNQFAYGQLTDSGSFEVETLLDGKITQGLPPGKYRARLVISDDDIDHKRSLQAKIEKRYLSFETSGWEVEVPGKDIRLTIQ